MNRAEFCPSPSVNASFGSGGMQEDLKGVEIKIKKTFFPQNPDLAGLMMAMQIFQFWPFWPKLLRFKVAFKFATPADIWVKCEPVGIF